MSEVTSNVTLIVPTVHHRAELFLQTLKYFSHLGWRGPIIVSDYSPQEHLGTISGLVNQHSDLNVGLRVDPPEAHFLARLAGCAQDARTDYVHLHADDDFLVFATLSHLHDFMESNPGCAAAMGVNIQLTVASQGIAVLTKTGSSQPDPFNRLLSRLEKFSSVLYALRRRSEFIDSVFYAQARCPDVQFWQYLETCQTVLSGTIAVMDHLHYVRKRHEKQWSNQLAQERSPDHFPHLILSPNFQPRVAAFGTALIDACTTRGIAVDHGALDDGLIRLLHRGFGAMGLPQRRTTEELVSGLDQIMKRIQDENDPARQELVRIYQAIGA